MLSQKHEDQSTGGGDGSGGRSTSSLRPPAEQTLKCPRCDSPNTKFCYYNNYNLAQPRHFCKACRRYWTKGGALRNVPIGGNCRKNKKTKSYSKYSSSNIENNMKMFGLSTLDFQLGSGLNFPPRVTTANQLCSSYGDHTSSNHSLVNLDPLGYNLPFSSNNNIVMGNNNIASSIESLSSINQDLHWKLQQQRLAMLFGGGGPHNQKVQPILFQNLETSKPAQSSINGDSGKESIIGGSSGLATEWFFDNSYAPGNMNNQGNSSNGNGAGNDENGSMDNWNGIQSWNDHLNQYSDGVSYEG